jgi:hypothetical protein
MRFIVMHKTDARWEAGEIPGRGLIERVGRLIAEMVEAGVFLAGEGLRPSSEGVLVTRAGGVTTVREGPFSGEGELPLGFSIVKADSVGAAAGWAARLAEALDDVEVVVRPVTEPWDIGLAPPPAGPAARRYMALRRATAATEAGTPNTPAGRAAADRLIGEGTRGVTHLSTVSLHPSRRGRRYKNSREGLRVLDGPFTESKELIAGYMMFSAESLEEAGRWALRYLDVVEADEVDLREVDDVGCRG